MRVAIVYNEPRSGAEASDQDVLVQRDAVTAALTELGHTAVSIPCTLNLSPLADQLTAGDYDVVFNLVESLHGTDRLQVLVPFLLDGLQIPYTGTSGTAMMATTDKVSVKRRLRELKLPTTDWVEADSAADVAVGRFIVKARYEHASLGMDDNAVVDVKDIATLKDIVRERTRKTGHEMFAERFIDGREFNISVLAEKTGRGLVLAPAEIDFSAFPEDKPRIIGYDAKWTENSFEFNATPRSFKYTESDKPLLEKLSRLSEVIWQTFNLGGYVRVDYRVDKEGNPFVLEINTNPCLSPDAGFNAAVKESGHNFTWAVDRVITSALANHR